MAKTVAYALAGSSLEYANAVLYITYSFILNKLQWVQNFLTSIGTYSTFTELLFRE